MFQLTLPEGVTFSYRSWFCGKTMGNMQRHPVRCRLAPRGVAPQGGRTEQAGVAGPVPLSCAVCPSTTGIFCGLGRVPGSPGHPCPRVKQDPCSVNVIAGVGIGPRGAVSKRGFQVTGVP